MAEKVIVTGASGHAGANLVRALLEDGARVRVLVHRQVKALEGLNVEVIHGDVRDPVSLNRAFDGMDTVYHLAARISLSMGGWNEVDVAFGYNLSLFGQPNNRPTDHFLFPLLMANKGLFRNSIISREVFKQIISEAVFKIPGIRFAGVLIGKGDRQPWA